MNGYLATMLIDKNGKQCALGQKKNETKKNPYSERLKRKWRESVSYSHTEVFKGTESNNVHYSFKCSSSQCLLQASQIVNSFVKEHTENAHFQLQCR